MAPDKIHHMTPKHLYQPPNQDLHVPSFSPFFFFFLVKHSQTHLQKETHDAHSQTKAKWSPKDKSPKVMFAKQTGLWFGGNSRTSPGQVACTLWSHHPTAGLFRARQEEMLTVSFSFPSPLVLPDVLITEERERMILPICLHSTQINLLAVPRSSAALQLSHRNGCCRA